ncbi:ATP-dependent zinc protease [Aliarcobacter lanthieri]|uniref:ATP-dependent zinc protease family protein n=1 Tax=Arcobacteraceae TaxID=2808963 RepID=UPI000DE9521B|nr:MULTISPECIES: RimK/LysX family protein [Arcobacteraceae]MBL3519201.1 ATP-dependent zinc protease [Aliarcobacter lanthieri]RBQ26623.1 clan AA aspartic protease [Arcobacter sp. CECT 9188]
MSQLKIIGRKELVDILDLDLFGLDAKIDTGAYSNSLHCDDISIDNDGFVHFKLLDKIHPSYHGRKIKLPIYKQKIVKSSNGASEFRVFIQVSILFYGKRYKTVISLTNRKDMKYPMLIGRKFLVNRFLVDVSKENLASKNI